MLLKWIRLENIRSYTSAELKFPEGATLLSGDIGCGKSTILLSIEFVLFGLIKGEISGNTLLRKGEKQGCVELCFSLGDDEIVIKRILKKKSTGISQESSYIILNGVKKEAAPVELKAKILELLGYPMDMLNKKNLIYRYTVYTPQEEMKRIIFESKDERLNTLRKTFGVEKYKRVRENSALVVKKMKDECKRIEGAISDLDAKKNLKKEINDKIEGIDKEMKPLNDEKQKKIGEVDNSEKSYDVKKKLLQEYNDYKSKIAKYDSEMQSIIKQKEENNILVSKIEDELKEIEVKDIDVSQKDNLEKDISERESKLIGLREKQSGVNEREIHLKKSVENVNNFLEKNKGSIDKKEKLNNAVLKAKEELSDKRVIQENIEKKNQELLVIEKEISSVQQKIEMSNGIINKMSKLDDCPLCLQKVDHNHKQGIIEKENKNASDFQKEIDEKNSKKAGIVDEIVELKKEIIKIEEQEKKIREQELELEQLKQIEKEIIEKKKELNELHNGIELVEKDKKELKDINLAEYEKNIIALKEKYKVIVEQISKLKLKEEKEKNMKNLITRNDEIKNRVMDINKIKLDMNKDIVKFKDIDEIVVRAEKELMERKEELKKIELQIAEKNTRKNSLKEEIQRMEKEIAEKEKQKMLMNKKRQYIDWIDKSFVEIITIIEKNILGSLYNEFNALFQEWFDILIEDELITSKLDDEFTPEVQQNGYDIEIENMSGGEKTALSLAYRLALNKVINDITTEVKTKDLIILDEPTDGFSEQQLDKIRDVLERLDMKQVIIVSHENKIESFVDNIIKISKEEHVSKVLA